jgi:LPS sulfotransferase NodH
MRSPRARFVIVSLGRSGSSLLQELLNAHPDIRCEGEILARRARAPRLLVSRRAALSRKPAYGFKLLHYQLWQVQQVEPANFLGWLRRRGFVLVYLRRHNLLRQALSNVSARRYGFHQRGRNVASARERIEVDPDELGYWLDGLAADDAKYQDYLSGVPHIEVVYEDDLIDEPSQQATVRRICAELGVTYAPVETDLVRLAPARIADLVSNYDDLVSALEGSPYGRFLD